MSDREHLAATQLAILDILADSEGDIPSDEAWDKVQTILSTLQGMPDERAVAPPKMKPSPFANRKSLSYEIKKFTRGKDKQGREFCVNDGVTVPCPGGAAATTGAQARKKERKLGGTQQGTSEEQATKQAIQQVNSTVMGKIKGAAGKTSDVLMAGWKFIPKFLRMPVSGVYHLLESPRIALEKMATEVAKERGLSEEHVKKVSKAIAVANFIEQWITNIPIAHEVAHAAGMHGWDAFAVAKVGAIVPVGALGYLAYSAVASTAKGDPMATIRAARTAINHTYKEVVNAFLQREHGEGHKALEQENQRELATMLLERGDNGDWYDAILAVTTDLSLGSLGLAIKIADAIYAKEPKGPRDMKTPKMKPSRFSGR